MLFAAIVGPTSISVESGPVPSIATLASRTGVLVAGVGDRQGQVQIADGGAGRYGAETYLIGPGHFLLEVRDSPVGLSDGRE